MPFSMRQTKTWWFDFSHFRTFAFAALPMPLPLWNFSFAYVFFTCIRNAFRLKFPGFFLNNIIYACVHFGGKKIIIYDGKKKKEILFIENRSWNFSCCSNSYCSISYCSSSCLFLPIFVSSTLFFKI